MPLGQPLAVTAQNHRHMRILRQRRAQCLEDVDLARRVVDMIVAADDMGDAHIQVVHHHAEVVCRRAIGTGDDQVIQLTVLEHDLALDHVVPRCRTMAWIPETHHRLDALRRSQQNLTLLRAPLTVVARLLTARALRLAQRVQFHR